MSAVPLVVQKFGGRCLDTDTAAAQSIQRVADALAAGLRPVVVVSAMGRRGQPYSTSELLKLLTDVNPIVHPRERDLLMACGEILAAVRVAHLLQSRGIRAHALTGGQAGILTTRRFGKARVTLLKADRIGECLSDGIIPCVTGFQGVSEVDHEVTTLGEGGSDYTAVALAAWLQQRSPLRTLGAVEVRQVEVYKENAGIHTADPHSLPGEDTLRIVPELSHAELEEVARYGHRVFQYEAAQHARAGAVRVCFRAADPARPGETWVVAQRRAPSGTATLALDLPELACFTLESQRGIAARERDLRGWVQNWLWQERGVLPLFLPAEPRCVTFAVRREQYREVPATVREAFEGTGLTLRVLDGSWAMVTLMGEGLRGRLRRTARAVQRSLEAAGVAVRAVESSELSVRAMVPKAQRQTALRVLHDEFVQATGAAIAKIPVEGRDP